ncbi:MAG: 3-oxoacyl-ACP reductase FabG [Bacteroidales bacterium]|nr:3-oxoacyl-ACP reductase FabG [Fournierella massiliensis]MCF2556916.1 3-oxoacyl-ACP reductase FabG [Fournierella massiliensis]MCI6740893.1 3-oxoacyl-ACP reductase FabG [Bacteroidales bacterium]
MRERTVLITGGSRGIGAASVRAFAGAGYRVAFSYHSHEAAARALEEELGGRARAFRADVADPAQVRRLFEECRSAFSPAEILICSAGIAQQKLFTDLTDQDWQRMLDVDLSGAFYCCRQALPDMIRARWGRILLVSSMWGQTGGSCEVHYSAAKAGLIGLGKALAKEEGPSGVTVNILAPGVVDTDMMAGFSPEDKQALAEETPVGRLGSPEEMARTLLFLAGEESGYITGQVLGQNGGLVI